MCCCVTGSELWGQVGRLVGVPGDAAVAQAIAEALEKHQVCHRRSEERPGVHLFWERRVEWVDVVGQSPGSSLEWVGSSERSE